MKKALILIVLGMFALGLSQAHAQVACGNGQQGGVGNPNGGSANNDATGGDNPDGDNTNAGDSVNIYTANLHSTVTDLQLFGGVGEHQLAMKRFTESRYAGTDEPFGAGSSIRHQYEWTLADYSANSSGAARMQLSYPDGTVNLFTQVSATEWQSTPAISDVLYQDGTQYTLQTKKGWQYHFATIAAGGSHYYQMQYFTDSHLNTYTLRYDGSNRVTSVTEPAGRSLSITYGNFNISGLSQVALARVQTAPSTGQWLQISFKATADRYFRFVGTSTVEIAEIQFLDAHNNVVAGTLFGTASSGPTSGLTNANDGNSTTYFESSDATGGYVGIDQGTETPVAIASVRILARSGYESNLVGGNLYGDTVAPTTASVITQVQASDGRAVTYSYQQVQNSTLPYTYPVLAGVSYPDGSAAQYSYTQTAHDTRPLVSDVVDPRHAGPFCQIHTDYYSSILGAVQDQVDPNGHTLLSIGIQGGDLHQPTVTMPTANGSTGTTVFIMNAAGIATNKQDPLGRTTTFAHSGAANGFITSMTDPLGNVEKRTSSTYGNILQIVHPDNSSVNFTRNIFDLVTSQADELNHSTIFTLDTYNRTTQISNPDGTSEGFTYNNFGQVLTHQLPSGATETSTYDARGLKQTQTDPVGAEVAFGYDYRDELVSYVDANGHTTTYTYNDRGQVTQITNPDGSTQSISYDTFGNTIAFTNEAGQTWSWTYGLFRRLLTATDPLNRTVAFTYSAGTSEDKPVSMTLPSGKQVTFAYDAAWQLTSTTLGAGTPDAATTIYTYDLAGNVLTQTDPNGRLWKFTYDSRHRKTSQTDPLNHTTSYTYDAVGNVLTVKRPDGGVTTNTYDTRNRLLTTTDPKGEQTTFTYDAPGNLLTVTDARNNTYTYTYDYDSRKTSMKYPDGSKESYGYDPAGNMVSYTTRTGQIETNTYDSRNRQVASSWSDGVTPNVARTFDAVGRLTSSGNGVSTSTYVYDSANQLLSETENVGIGSGWTVAYTYDVDGNRSTLTYPSGNVVSYGHTGRNQISSIAVSGTSLAGYTYDGNGNVVSKTLSDGTLASYSYDAANRLTTLNHTLSGTSLARFDYGYDSVNRRTYEKRDNAVGDVYGYDAIDQVSSVNYKATNPSSGTSGADRTVVYSYDASGNRTAVNDNVNGNASYTANSDNEYTAVGTASYAYDGNGNLITGNGLYMYDAQNRMTSAQMGSVLDQMAYDSKNRVVKRTVSGTTTYLVYDGWDLIEERDASNNVLATYVHGVRQDELLSLTNASGTVYYHHNANGSVTDLTNASGAVVEKYKYDAFGKPTITDGSGNPLVDSAYGNRFLFTGREYLVEINLYDYRNRVYSADLGRFMQTDPLSFSAVDANIYRYCGNDGVNEVDPAGTHFVTIGYTGQNGGIPIQEWIGDTDTPGTLNLHSASTVTNGAESTAIVLEMSGVKIGTNLKAYTNPFARGNQHYGIMADLGKIGKALGPGIAIVGVGLDWAGVVAGGENPYLASANTIMAGVGLFGGPAGEIAAALFFGGEFAYNLWND